MEIYMSVKLSLLASLFLEALSVWYYCRNLFVANRKFPSCFFFFCSLYSFLFLSHSFTNAKGVILNLSLFFFVNFFLIKKIYITSLTTSLIHSSLLTFMSVISEISTGYICDKVIVNYWYNWNSEENLIYMSLSCLLFFFSTWFLSSLQKKYSPNDISTKTEFAIFLGISLCITIVIFLIFFYVLSADHASLQLNVVILCIVLLSIIFLLNVILYNYMQKKHMEYIQIQKQLQFENDTETLIEEIKKRDISQRILIHDIKNHLNSIANLCHDERATQDYISKIIASPALKPPLRYCSNDFINTILYRYSQSAKSLNIAFNIEIINVQLNHVSNYDLTVIFCNLLDNAFEAACLCDKPEINLIMSSDSEKQINIIKITNSCIDSVDVKKMATTKKDKSSHGFGLISVTNSLDKYGGYLHQYKDNQSGILTSVIIISWGPYDKNSNM